ncbi:MAG: RimK family alpha-L-glutamate ligase [Oscillospiraceae bacterium]|nr:RimK family alpha-L-glutamate ligase [Oscillospiraceae bacterium]
MHIVYNGYLYADGPPHAVRALAHALGRAGGGLPVPHTDYQVSFDESGVRVAYVPGGAAAVNVNGAGTKADTPSGSGGVFSPLPDACIFWDKDTRLAFALEAAGVRLYNTAAAVAACDDKALTHLRLAESSSHGVPALPTPATLLAPATYDAHTHGAFARRAAGLGFPLVLKECFGSLGGQVYLVRDEAELKEKIAQVAPRPFLAQAFVAPGGEDLRLYMVGEECGAAMRRVNTQDFRANIAAGGTAHAYTPSAEELALARACMARLGLHFAGVDLFPGGLVCEVNASAQFEALEEVTGADVARRIVDYVEACERRR